MDHPDLISNSPCCRSVPPRFKRTAQTVFTIPLDWHAKILPSSNLSLKEFTDFIIPSQVTRPPTGYNLKAIGFFSKTSPSEITSTHLIKLRHLSTPDAATVQELSTLGHQAWLDGYQSIYHAHLIPNLSEVIHFPMWIITYWKSVVDIKNVSGNWVKSRDWIMTQFKQNKSAERRELAETASIMLLSLPWSASKPSGCSDGNDPIHTLWRYLGPNWLTSSEQDDLLELLRREILDTSISCSKFRIQNTYFTTILLDAFNSNDYHSSNRFSWLRRLGEDLAQEDGVTLLTVVHLGEITNSAHWVPLAIQKDGIFYGDSLKMEMPEKLRSACVWWLQHHVPRSQPSFQPLPITTQSDGHSCGILADNALRHFVFPANNPLLGTAGSDIIAQRLKLFNVIAQNIIQRVRSDSSLNLMPKIH
jgi:hypothetical protein